MLKINKMPSWRAALKGRSTERRPALKKGRSHSALLAMTAVFFLLTAFSSSERTAADVLKKIPVQSGGRAMPFETFAAEALRTITGKRSFEGKKPVEVVLDWMAQPEAWMTKSFLPAAYPELKKEFGLRVIGGKITPELVLTHGPFQTKVSEALARQEKKETLTPVEKKRIELYEQARFFQTIAEGLLPGFFPDLSNPEKGWKPLAALADPERRSMLEQQYTASGLASVQASLSRLFLVLRESKDQAGAVEAAKQFRFLSSNLLESHGVWIDHGKISLELFYRQIRPFLWASIFYLLSGLVWFLTKDRWPPLPLSFLVAGFALHTMGFVLRCLIIGRPPVSNMYESIVWVAWAAVFFASLLGLICRKSILPASSVWVAAFALLISESSPALLDPSLAPLVPVLRNNYWLTIHVLTITLSYGAFALAWGIAHAQLFSSKFDDSLYRAVQIGVVLLAAGTILGGVWANESWGRFWGWDPKETWALIALLIYLIILHARFMGWIGSFGMAVSSAAAFLSILMAWYGVNFVLAAGLHSYGFGGGGLSYVLTGVLIDLSLVSFLAFRYHTREIPRSLTGKKKGKR